MKIGNIYSHLNGREFMMIHKPTLLKEIFDAIHTINANDFVKQSKDKTHPGKLLYDQKGINKEFERLLKPLSWNEVRTPYYVTTDIPTIRETVKLKDKDDQKALIESKGFEALKTYNQVDFVKERVALEVQFGKYFSVAYDLHVKHTFFFLRNDIDVGIEIIPTREMMLRMDTGVAWFENEVANVIREGRSNPTVPIIMIGIEPDILI